METCDEFGGCTRMLKIAVGAGVNESLGIAGLARVEVSDARREFGLEFVQSRDLRFGLAELVAVERAHAVHGAGRRAAVLPALDDLADVGERETHVLQLRDPTHA